MILQLPCPGCGLVLGVDARLAGGAVICSRCQRTVAVPAPAPGGPPAPYPYPYPYPYVGAPGALPGPGPDARAASGLRIAGGVIGIAASLIFVLTAVGAIDVFEPRFGPGVAGLLALAALALGVWGVVIASLACTRRRWAWPASAWTQVALGILPAPSFVFALLGQRGPSDLQDMFRVVFPMTVVLSGTAAVFSLLSSRRTPGPGHDSII